MTESITRVTLFVPGGPAWQAGLQHGVPETPEAFTDVEKEFRALAEGRLPIAVETTEVALMERREGLWTRKHAFPLGGKNRD